MGEAKDDRCVDSLDIILPVKFIQETLAVHNETSTTAYPWEGITTFSKHYKIVTNIESDDTQKLLHVSIQSIDLKSSDENIVCKFKSVERDMTSSVWSEKSYELASSFNSNQVEVGIDPNIIHVHDDEPSHNISNTVSSNSKQSTKRKRGRPKKSESKLDKENKVSTNEENSQIISKSTGSRYGLRGVKLSEVIMRAEKGLYSDPTTEQNNQVRSTEKTEDINQENSLTEHETVTSEQDLEEQKVSEVGDDVIDNNTYQASKVDTREEEGYWGEILSDDDQEVFTEKRKKRGRPKKIGSLEPSKRMRNKIDLGDSIPVFERRKRNKDKKSECKYCQKKFCDYTGVDAHVRKYHNKEVDVDFYLESIKDLKVEKCSICDQKFEDRIQLQYHENRNHFRGQPVKCNKCKKTYKNFLSLRNHVTAVHSVNGQPHLCHLCPAKFKWAVTLRQHIDEIHEGKMDFVCKICKKAFARKPQLKRHERIHGVDESKKLCCTICSKSFWYECNFKRHMKLVHGPHEESHHCSYCGKGFNMKGAMVNHVQHVHLNIHTFKCSQCKMGFRRKKLLEEHMAQAHSDVEYSAAASSRRYKYGRTSEDLFYCSYCSLSFCYKTKMIEHMHIDHGKDFPHVCKHCCQGFMEKSFLLNHLLKAHGVEVTEEEFEEEYKDQSDHVQTDQQCRIVTVELDSRQRVEEAPHHQDEVQSVAENIQIINQEGEITVTEAESDAQAASMLLEVASGANTVHYVIEQPQDGGPTIIPQELSNLLLAAEISGTEEVELTCDGQTYTYMSKTDDIIEEVPMETVSSDVIIDDTCQED